MDQRRGAPLFSSIAILVFCGLLIGQSDDPAASARAHAECAYFGPNRSRFVEAALRGATNPQRTHALSSVTEQVTAMRSYVPHDATPLKPGTYPAGSIDSYIFADFQANQITPAPKTTDWEFIRRASLDLTGRIPAPDRVLSFVADSAPDKRAKLIDELLAQPQWVDKWAMYFGDL